MKHQQKIGFVLLKKMSLQSLVDGIHHSTSDEPSAAAASRFSVLSVAERVAMTPSPRHRASIATIFERAAHGRPFVACGKNPDCGGRADCGLV
jgi:hypothetical protein